VVEPPAQNERLPEIEGVGFAFTFIVTEEVTSVGEAQSSFEVNSTETISPSAKAEDEYVVELLPTTLPFNFQT
jgi:hypothetical protein